MRVWNAKESAHDEAIRGLMLACPGKYRRLESAHGCGLLRADPESGRVRVIIDGGGGYGPMWTAFASDGLADAMVHGNFDSAPNAWAVYETAREIEDGAGVLLLANHFMGDYLNNDFALDLLAHDGIAARACYVSDDILSCRGEEKEARGGLHGIGQVCRIASAAAAAGLCLDEVYRLAEKANSRLRSVTVNLREGRLWFGEGFSGEPAAFTMPYRSVDQMMEEAVSALMVEMRGWIGDNFYVSVNPHNDVGYIEGLVLLNSAVKAVTRRGIAIAGCGVGTYFDVFEGEGCMLSLLACDGELARYLPPVSGYGFTL